MRFFIVFSQAGVRQILNGKIEPINHSIQNYFHGPPLGYLMNRVTDLLIRFMK